MILSKVRARIDEYVYIKYVIASVSSAHWPFAHAVNPFIICANESEKILDIASIHIFLVLNLMRQRENDFTRIHEIYMYTILKWIDLSAPDKRKNLKLGILRKSGLRHWREHDSVSPKM